MIYNINTALEINMLNRQEKALRDSLPHHGSAYKASETRLNKVLWTILHMFAAPRLF